jgi:catechol 2,3-dioxygenase-like lactoylglutathione lyase family enzyme
VTLSSFYPVLAVEAALVGPERDFYVAHFGFTAVFDTDWYVAMQHHDGDRLHELGILQLDHPSMPAPGRHPARGLLLTIEVDDVDAEHQRLINQAGLPVVQDLRDEDFGQRHFITHDPAGVLIDVVTPLALD